MSDLMIPYWMWAASLLVLALLCGAVLSAAERDEHRAMRRQPIARRNWWRAR